MTYRKIGGIHWLGLGRLRFSFCVVRKPQTTIYKPLPKVHHLADFYDDGLVPEDVRQLLSRPDSNINYRNAMLDSGRGRLLR
jgi:hypothetical protein